ncbi:Hypothetical protein ERS124359_00409 [Mycobacterium tuberculosis]|nr:Hypothetical protein ERS075367_01680 [Mycobacterium tuberculosis]CNF84827.1 Hypothetical protein ERS075366_02322 [Mycobacterium tuberculosis]CNK43905.1 Hypothetical protein ERS124359_00409 [Mycobacterium tuberculosis]
MDLHSRPPWSNNAVRRLGVALRDGVDPPVDCPSYAEVMLWHADLAAEVQDRIEGRSWSASELLVTSRAKSQDTLLAKLRRRPYLQLNTIQDIAGVRIDADFLLGEQTRLAREIADHFGADQPAIHDLRDHPHAGTGPFMSGFGYLPVVSRYRFAPFCRACGPTSTSFSLTRTVGASAMTSGRSS